MKKKNLLLCIVIIAVVFSSIFSACSSIAYAPEGVSVWVERNKEFEVEEKAGSYELMDSFEYDGNYCYYFKVGTVKKVIVDEQTPKVIEYNVDVEIQRTYITSRMTTTSIEKATSDLLTRVEHDNPIKDVTLGVTGSVGFPDLLDVSVKTERGVEYYSDTTTKTSSSGATERKEEVLQEQDEIKLTFDKNCKKGFYRICKVTDYDVFLFVSCPKSNLSIENCSFSYGVKPYNAFRESYEYSEDGFSSGSCELNIDMQLISLFPVPTRVVNSKDVQPSARSIIFDADGGLFSNQKDKEEIYYNGVGGIDLNKIRIPYENPVKNNCIFVGWVLPNGSVCTVESLKKYCLENNENVTVKARWVDKNFVISDSTAKRVKDNSSGIFYELNIHSLKDILSNYSLKIVAIRVKFNIQEHDDGYQEFYLANTKNTRWKDNTHCWNDGELIVGEYAIETVPGKKGSGTFDKQYSVDLKANNLPISERLYFYIGAHGSGGDDWTCSDLSITFLIEKG